MTYTLLTVAFLAGLLLGRRWMAGAEFSIGKPQTDPCCDVATVTAPEARPADDVVKGLQTTRTALADLLRSFEDCEAQLKDATDSEQLANEWHALLGPMESVKEMLAVSYDQLRLVQVAGSGIAEGREQLHDWLTRRLALLNRYGNSVSLAVVQFRRDSKAGAAAGDRIDDLTRILGDFIRDTDRLFVYSDDEFVVGLPETVMEEACLFAARCRQTMRREFGLDARLGVTELFADDNGRTVLTRADAALHHSLADASEPLFSHDGNALNSIPEESALDRLMSCPV